MGLRKHLVDMHTAHGEFHRDCAKAHDAYGKTLSDGEEKELHTSLCKAHLAHAERCIASARHASTLDDSIPTGGTGGPKIAKLATDEDRFADIVPDGVRGAGDPANGLRLVPRDSELGNLAKTQPEDNLAQHPAFARRDTSVTS